MDRRLFISGLIIFIIAGFIFMAGYLGNQDIILKLTVFSPEKYELYKMMESIGGIAAVIGILISLAGIVEKNK